MTQEMTRKKFLQLGVGAATVALVPGCPASDDGETGADSSTTDSTTSPTTTSPTTTNMTTTSPTSTDTTTTDTTTSPTTTDTTESSTDPDTGSTTDPDTGSTDASSSEGSSSSGESSSEGGFNGCTDDPTSSFSAHAHTLDIPLADVMGGAMQMYVAGGGHTHNVTLTAGDFATLNAEGQVVVNSAPGGLDGHTHVVTINCV